MKILACLLLIAAAGGGPAAEFALVDKTTVTCDELLLAKELPRTLVTAKTGKETRTYKASEVDLASLPGALRDEFQAFQKEQLQKRIILKDDKWIHRDEVLLNEDARYAWKKPLAKLGDSIIEFVNTTEGVVTIGMRSGDRGYEMHIEAGKKKSYQVPDGDIFYILAHESADGTQLVVQKSKAVAMKHLRYQVTIVKSDEIPREQLGSIPIPREYQVAP
jgi:hypothetical protein